MVNYIYMYVERKCRKEIDQALPHIRADTHIDCWAVHCSLISQDISLLSSSHLLIIYHIYIFKI